MTHVNLLHQKTTADEDHRIYLLRR